MMYGKDLPEQCRSCAWLKCYSVNMSGPDKSVFACHQRPLVLAKALESPCGYRMEYDAETKIGRTGGDGV